MSGCESKLKTIERETVTLDLFLNPADSARATRTLHDLLQHDVARFALTGGAAIELQILAHGGKAVLRPLNDLDFLVGGFEDIPASLGSALLLRHVHPKDPPAKTLLQGVDAATSVRVDVFRAYGSEMERAEMVAGVPLRVVSLKDLVARHARLCWDLVDGKRVAPKFARDFLRMAQLVGADRVETIWGEHRKPWFAVRFEEAALEIRRAIEMRADLLITPEYSTDELDDCPRCHDTPGFFLAPAEEILSYLGYS